MKLNLPKRLQSLDVFRGITIVGMILVENPGSQSYIYPPLRHAEWNGCTFADLIFPFFLFIAGVTIAYSLTKRLDEGCNQRQILLHVARRTIILFALGLFLNGFPHFDFSTLRVMGVLQRIAICYFFASVSFLYFRKAKQQVSLVALLLFLYWILMKFVPVPGYGAGVLEKEGNLAQYIDYLILKGHMWQKTWDPEGILSTVPAVATTLLGVTGGQYLRSNHPAVKKTLNLTMSGILLIVIGIVSNVWFPINKNLWTSSYAAFTGGMAILFLAACHYLIDVKRLVSRTKMFVIFGMNAIVVYVMSEAVSRILGGVSITLADKTTTPLNIFLYEHFFASWAGSLNGSLLYALTYVAIWLGIMSLFYKKRIFVKI